MHLRDNILSGGVPSGLAELNRLRKLILDGNQLTGEIPSQTGDMDRRGVMVQGQPVDRRDILELESLSPLTALHLERNGFIGRIPSDLRDIEDNELNLPDSLSVAWMGNSRVPGTHIA